MRTKKRGARVLIVDDEENVREIMNYILEERGFIVQEARDGREALKKIFKSKPDIIILDVSMPGMDGFQTCAQLRKNPHTQDIPIIFLSAQKCITKVIGNMPGATIEYIEKPFDLTCLLRRIDCLLAERSLLK